MTRLLKWNTADVLPLIEEVRRCKESISGQIVRAIQAVLCNVNDTSINTGSILIVLKSLTTGTLPTSVGTPVRVYVQRSIFVTYPLINVLQKNNQTVGR
jgi:hypothetical protein